MFDTCFNCNYYRQEKLQNGEIEHYCKHLECIVNPYDPECKYN